MGFFSCGSCMVSLVLLLALCCAATVDARTGLIFSRLQATNRESISSKFVTQLKRSVEMENQASGARFAQHSVESELRWVPSGPDPMHHHASPMKPQAP